MAGAAMLVVYMMDSIVEEVPKEEEEEEEGYIAQLRELVRQHVRGLRRFRLQLGSWIEEMKFCFRQWTRQRWDPAELLRYVSETENGKTVHCALRRYQLTLCLECKLAGFPDNFDRGNQATHGRGHQILANRHQKARPAVGFLTASNTNRDRIFLDLTSSLLWIVIGGVKENLQSRQTCAWQR